MHLSFRRFADLALTAALAAVHCAALAQGGPNTLGAQRPAYWRSHRYAIKMQSCRSAKRSIAAAGGGIGGDGGR